MPPFAINIPSPALPFPTYLVPSLPFRRRQSSSASTSSSSSNSDRSASIASASTAPTALSTTPEEEPFLTGATSHLRCARCLSDLALSTQIISKGFTGRHGRAYLVAPSPTTLASDPSSTPPRTAAQKNALLPNLPNTFAHKPVPRQLVTGAHTVSDVGCAQCGAVLGWKYVAAEDEGQRYKVGKFILETRRVCRSSTWEGEEGEGGGVVGLMGGGGGGARRKSSLALPPERIGEADGEVEFDSQDEDECEDLFMGVWTPQLAARRRRARVVERLEE